MSVYKYVSVGILAFGLGAMANEKGITDSLFNNDKETVTQPTTPNGQTTTTLGAIANESTTTIPVFSIDTGAIECGDIKATVVVDTRAQIGATLSLLKAIDLNIPGATSRELPSEVVNDFVIAIAKANGRDDIDTQAEIDNFPAGTYTIATPCSLKAGSVFIP